MTIQFGYDKKQVIQALRYHFLNRPELKVLVIIINLFALTSAVFFYLKYIQTISFLIFSLLWFALMLVIWRFLPGSIYKKSHTFKDHFSMSFQDEHIVLRTQMGERSWSWKQISYYMESPYFFHLYFDAKSFFLVPKDAMQGDPSTIEVRKFISERVRKG